MTTSRLLRRIVLPFGVVLAGFLVAVVVGLAGQHKAYAAPVTGQFIDIPVPTAVRDYLENCGYTNNAAAQIGWLSLPNQTDVQVTSVPKGTPSIQLWYNVAGIVCDQSRQGGLQSTTNGVISTTPNMPTLNGQVVSYSYGNYTGAFSHSQYVFDFTPPSGSFVVAGDYHVDVYEKRINTYSTNPVYRCVTNAGDVNFRTPNSSTDFDACASVGISPLDFRVEIQDAAPAGYIENESCTTLSGWAYDSDSPGTSLFVDVYVSNDPNSAGTGVGRFTANGNRPDLPPSWGANHGFTIPADVIQRYADMGPHYFRVYAIGVDDSGTPNGNNPPLPDIKDTSRQYVTIGPCGKVTCNVNTQPSIPSVNQPFNIVFTYTYQHGDAGPPLVRPVEPTASVIFNGGSTQTYGFPSSYDGGSHTFSGFSQSQAGQYTIQGWASQNDANGNYTTPHCDNTNIAIATQPYVKFFGNSVSAGGAFDTGHNNCSSDQVASTGTAAAFWTFLKSTSYNGQTYYGGGSSQFGAFAKGRNLSFFTAGNRNGASAAPTPAVGLSFGNMVKTSSGVSQSITSDNYGGQVTMTHCIPDYFGAHTSPLATTAPNQVINGDFTLSNNLAIGNGTQKVIFVSGNAYINSPINFASTNWSDPSQIPSFYLIVQGNIYINSIVTQLDGVYVAEPRADGSQGNIYTCTTGSGLYPGGALYNNCKNPLTVTGSFVAKQIHYQRTRGDVNSSIATAPTAPDPVNWGWSSAGVPSGYDPNNCAYIQEGAEPPQYTWRDNYLCTGTNLGIYWLNAGTNGTYNQATGSGKKNPSDQCILVNPPTEPAQYYWGDNYLCAPASSNLQLSFVDTDAGGSTAGKNCVNITETADPNWMTGWGTSGMYSPYYICTPSQPAPPYTVTNEDPGSSNIAEIFNFSQELYLAPQPKVLESVTGGTSSIGKNYDSITSLPPVL